MDMEIYLFNIVPTEFLYKTEHIRSTETFPIKSNDILIVFELNVASCIIIRGIDNEKATPHSPHSNQAISI